MGKSIEIVTVCIYKFSKDKKFELSKATTKAPNCTVKYLSSLNGSRACLKTYKDCTVYEKAKAMVKPKAFAM